MRYRLASLLAVAVCAVLAGASTFAAIADWVADLDQPARRRLGFASRIPVGSTVWRFLVRPRRAPDGHRKGQPAHLGHQLRTLPWAQVPVGHRTRSRGHGRTETRTVKAVTVQTPGGWGFPHAAQAVRITRTRTIAGATSRGTAYLIVTLPAAEAQPVDLNHWARGQWTSKTVCIGSAM